MPKSGTRGAFAPSAAMRKYAEACAAATGEKDMGGCLTAAGVSESTARRWHRAPRFRAWLNAEVLGLLRGEVWRVWWEVTRKAREGDLQAAKLFLQRFDAKAGAEASAPEEFRRLADLAGSPEGEEGEAA